ncbi:MAG TPA: hypothetical protein DF613_08900 [Lachnospiraceae bacterium]|nr:hypothetical protein [Lachnospiraceae bacterium]
MNHGRSIAPCKHPNYSPALAHSHHFFEAQYVVEGIFTHSVSNYGSSMKQGDFCLISPDIEHNL